jgi:hypothetical protein
MVFELPSEFCASDDEVDELALGAKIAAFEKPEKLGAAYETSFCEGILGRQAGAARHGGRRGRHQCHANVNVGEDGIQG